MEDKQITFHTLSLDISKNISLTVNSLLGRGEVLTAELGQSFSTGGSLDVNQQESHLELTWGKLGHLRVQHQKCGEYNHRYDFSWESYKPKNLVDGYDLGTGFWYGGAQVKQQLWPLNKSKKKSMAYVCGNSFENDYGGVQERYWLQSNGVALFVDESVPLFVAMNYNNDRRITLTSKFDSPYKNPSKVKPFLKYTLLQSQNVRTCQDFAVEQMFAKPVDIPNEDIFRYPIWSTWAQYKKNINQDVILDFADKIQEHGFKSSQLEIDDDWTPSYGDMEFDKSKFPGAKYMIQQLKEKGYRVTVWVHPFASPKSSAARKSYWVKGTLTGVSTWWNGLGKSLDVTNPGACAWFKGSLKALKEDTGIDSFKFDAGETNWLPSGWKTHEEMSNPNTYTKKYAELCASIDPDLRALEVRVGCRTQHLPVFVRMMDKDSRWDSDNGLQTLIPHALTFSLLGYPFILPDMIGGNAYKGMPDKELYIRWLQANALLPSLQYSIVPWQYDDEVVAIAKKMNALHEKYADLIITLARLAVQTGEPIIRPLWWVSPYDELAQTVDSEFLLGDDIVVAPVLEANARSRDIYLPAGRWMDQNTKHVLGGGRWYNDYPAKLNELPYFVRQERKVFPRKPSSKKPAPPAEEKVEGGPEGEDDGQKSQEEEQEDQEGQGEGQEGQEEDDGVDEAPEQDVPEDEQPGAGGGEQEKGGAAAKPPPPNSLAEELRRKMQDFWERRYSEEEEENVVQGDEFGSAFATKE